jgi:cytochrome b subunit of formate dehydrogenase
MHWLIEIFESVVGTPSQGALYGFCQQHFAWACIAAFLLLLIVGAIIVSSFLELARELRHVSLGRRTLVVTLAARPGACPNFGHRSDDVHS